LRIKEQETRLTLQEHDDDDDDEFFMIKYRMLPNVKDLDNPVFPFKTRPLGLYSPL
jgi:hypothetical protein